MTSREYQREMSIDMGLRCVGINPYFFMINVYSVIYDTDTIWHKKVFLHFFLRYMIFISQNIKKNNYMILLP